MFPSVCSDDWVIDLTENEGTPRARQQTNCPTEYFELCAFRIQFNEINLLNIYFRKVLVKGYNRDSDRLDAVNMWPAQAVPCGSRSACEKQLHASTTVCQRRIFKSNICAPVDPDVRSQVTELTW